MTMAESGKNQKIAQAEGDKLIPLRFIDILVNRYLPVVSLTYIASVIGIALKTAGSGDDIFRLLMEDPYAYHMALWVGLWVSIPAMIWIVAGSTFHLRRVADLWYRVSAGLMITIVLVSLFLFPLNESGFGVRIFMVASIPVFAVQYILFVRGGLPALAAWPLTVAGITALVYGLVL